MTNHPKLGRRAFLKTTGAGAAVVVAGSGLAGALTRRGRGRARFARTEAFPDAPVEVTIELPGAPEGAEVAATLFVETPRETLAVPLAGAPLSGGRAVFEVTLAYPYDTRVAGDYRYHVCADLGGRRAVTAEPAGYSVRRIHWFS